MRLKDKIFEFGIYGKEAKLLTKDELAEIKTVGWIEILTPVQIEEFRNHFTLSRFQSYPMSGDIPDKYVIRMNLHRWRAYLFGPGFITTNKYYFQVVDYLLKSHDFVPCSTLRAEFSIDPKTMHYICKKLRLLSLILEKRTGVETLIKLDKLQDRAEEKTKEHRFVGDFRPVDTKKLIFYRNVPFIEQLRMHVCRAEDGFGTREINEITGMKLKTALKHLQMLQVSDPDRFKIMESIEHGHNTFKMFSVENLDRRNAKKLEEIKNVGNSKVDPILTPGDRQKILKLLAERDGYFAFSKEILAEISQMTGYPYTIDRKNLISNAKMAGLNVFKLEEAQKCKYIVAQKSYDEKAIKQFYELPTSKIELSKFGKSVQKYFMGVESCVVADNGYPGEAALPSRFLYGFLFGHGCTEFSYQTVLEMTVDCFLKTTKIKKSNLIVRCAFEIFKKCPGRFTVDPDKLVDLFVGTTEPKKINEAIYRVLSELRHWKMDEFVAMLPREQQDALREFSRPQKYMKKLKGLESQGLIVLKIDPQNRIFVSMSDISMEMPLLVPTALKYNSRVDFVIQARNFTREEFREKAEKILPEIFSRSEERAMQRLIRRFLKDEKDTRKQTQAKSGCQALTDSQLALYLRIKKALLFHTPIDFRILLNCENIDIEDVLEYMKDKGIIFGFRTVGTISKIDISAKLKSFLKNCRFESSQTLVSDLEYYRSILPLFKSVVATAGTIDFDHLQLKAKYFEKFEVEKILNLFSSEFSVEQVDGFAFISCANIVDPFETMTVTMDHDLP